MTVPDALAFIQKLGSRPDLQEKLRSLGHRAELKDLVDMGGQEGHAFTDEELRVAFAKDWSIRRVFYGAEKLSG